MSGVRGDAEAGAGIEQVEFGSVKYRVTLAGERQLQSTWPGDERVMPPA